MGWVVVCMCVVQVCGRGVWPERVNSRVGGSALGGGVLAVVVVLSDWSPVNVFVSLIRARVALRSPTAFTKCDEAVGYGTSTRPSQRCGEQGSNGRKGQADEKR